MKIHDELKITPSIDEFLSEAINALNLTGEIHSLGYNSPFDNCSTFLPYNFMTEYNIRLKGWKLVGAGECRVVYRYRKSPYVIKIPRSKMKICIQLNLSEVKNYQTLARHRQYSKYGINSIVVDKQYGITACEYVDWDNSRSPTEELDSSDILDQYPELLDVADLLDTPIDFHYFNVAIFDNGDIKILDLPNRALHVAVLSY